jgi:hypothetical protein
MARDAMGRSGRPVLRRVVDASTAWMRDGARALVSGVRTLAGWFTHALQGLTYRHYAGALALTGGETPPAESLDQLDDDIDRQGGLLVRFRNALVEGTVATGKAVVARAGSYGGAIWGVATNAYRKTMQALRRQFERRVLGDVEAHCHECPHLARLGWRVIGSLPAIGATICSLGCHCWFEYK